MGIGCPMHSLAHALGTLRGDAGRRWKSSMARQGSQSSPDALAQALTAAHSAVELFEPEHAG